MKLSNEQIKEFASYLSREEKSIATQEKYLRDVQAFYVYADGNEITKELVVAWKKQLVESGYAVRSINSMLASVNGLLDFLGLSNCKVKNIRTQRQTYCAEDKELSRSEYLRLLAASKKNEQLNLVIQTIFASSWVLSAYLERISSLCHTKNPSMGKPCPLTDSWLVSSTRYQHRSFQ